jgi:rSAM/selenodomain-associated transferase 1
MILRKDLLMIFAKFPEPGRVKTRLARELGNETAAEIYVKLVERVVENVGQQGDRAAGRWEIWVVFDPADREAEVREWLEPLFPRAVVGFLAQGAGDLGARLAGAFGAAFRTGFEKVIAIGTDCVELGAAEITEGFQLLEGVDVVFGPAADGGYYLVGLSEERGELFAGIPWSSARALEASLGVTEREGWSHATLAVLSDVDEVAQWEALRAGDARWGG